MSYNRILGTLRENGVIRTNRVVADYGEYIASKNLGLSLNKSPSQKGYDATDAQGRKYQIKARKDMPYNKATIFPADLNKLDDVDYLIYVGFSDDWKVRDLLKIPKNEIRPNKHNRVILTKDLKKRFSIL